MNPRRASAPGGFGRRRVRIRFGSKTLKPRDIVTFWSSEQQDAMPETARGYLAPEGVRLDAGEKL